MTWLSKGFGANVLRDGRIERITRTTHLRKIVQNLRVAKSESESAHEGRHNSQHIILLNTLFL